MKKIGFNHTSKILNAIVTKINGIIDKLVVDVKVNGTSVVVVNQDGEREADIDLSVSDQNVKQSPTTDNADYRILLSKSANDTEETDISRKNTNFKYNPSMGNLQVTKVNGNTVPSGSGNDTLAKTSDIPDMTNYIQKSQTSGLVKNDGTIDQTQYATMSDIPDELSDLSDDSTHRLVTDTEKSTWNNKSATDENVYQQDIYNALGYGYSFPLLASCSPNDDTETNLVNKLPKVKWDSQNDWLKIYGFGGVQASILALALDGGPILNRIYGNPQANYVATTLPNHEGVLTTEKNAVLWKQQNLLGAKNLLPYNPYNPNGYVQNGITFTVTKEGYVIANGTKTTASNNSTFNISERYENTGLFLPNGTYRLSGCPSGGSTTTYQIGVAYQNSSGTYTNFGFDDGEGVEFTVNGSQYSDKGAWTRVFVVLRGGYSTANNLTFKPMIRLASISDSTYESPSNTNRQLTLNKLSWEENKASGVKNYFPYPYYLHPLQGETYTQRGVQWTDNGDRGIKANGTNDNTGNSYCQILPTSLQSGVHFCKLPQGKYHFSGGISADYYMNLSTGLETSPTDRTVIDYDYGNGFDFEVTEAQARDNIFCAFTFVLKGKTANNVVFYPMITRYEDSSKGYADYAMTNAELTQFKADMDNIAPTETSGIAVNSYAVGDYMWWRHGFYRVTQAISVGDTITTSKVTKTTLGAELKRALT